MDQSFRWYANGYTHWLPLCGVITVMPQEQNTRKPFWVSKQRFPAQDRNSRESGIERSLWFWCSSDQNSNCPWKDSESLESACKPSHPEWDCQCAWHSWCQNSSQRTSAAAHLTDPWRPHERLSQAAQAALARRKRRKQLSQLAKEMIHQPLEPSDGKSMIWSHNQHLLYIQLSPPKRQVLSMLPLDPHGRC